MEANLNIIIGTLIITLNLVPIVLKKYNYIKLTSIISFLILFIYIVLSNANAI